MPLRSYHAKGFAFWGKSPDNIRTRRHVCIPINHQATGRLELLTSTTGNAPYRLKAQFLAHDSDSGCKNSSRIIGPAMPQLLSLLLIPMALTVAPSAGQAHVDTTITRTIGISAGCPGPSDQVAYSLCLEKVPDGYSASMFIPQEGVVREHRFGLTMAEAFDHVDYRWVDGHTVAFRLYSTTSGASARFRMMRSGPDSVHLKVDD